MYSVSIIEFKKTGVQPPFNFKLRHYKTRASVFVLKYLQILVFLEHSKPAIVRLLKTRATVGLN